HAAAFAHLQQQAAMKVPRRHVELYDTIMGCLGYTSPDGGINDKHHVGIIQTFRRDVGELLRRVNQRFVV
ncbi:hypothetical protein, partial [Klebsiella pneumoniae]|uniref:hypothetical protein n=1 Tax=Klebsiella pneumoniae TaxID=573 RepID=UPI0035B69A08